MYKRAIIIGGGHSTAGFDWDLIKHEFTFAINYSYKFLEPTCLVLDNNPFYDSNKDALNKLDCVKISHTCNRPNVINIPSSNQYYGKNSLKRKAIYLKNLTGIYTLNLVSCLPFEEIYLLGYDMNVSADGELHNKTLKHPHNSLTPYRPNLSRFDVFKNLVGVYNVNLKSAINIFQKISYSDFTSRLQGEIINQTEARKWLLKSLNHQ